MVSSDCGVCLTIDLSLVRFLSTFLKEQVSSNCLCLTRTFGSLTVDLSPSTRTLRNYEMWDCPAQNDLGRIRIEPPVKLRFVQIGVTRHKYLPCHRYDLLDQRNNGRILSNREPQVGWWRDFKDGDLMGKLVDCINNEVYCVRFSRALCGWRIHRVVAPDL